jgi:hypothetical protein
MDYGKDDKCPEKRVAPDVIGVVEIISNTRLCLVGPV